MWPGHSDHNQVLPFYRKLDQEIRKVHPNYISFFESVPFPDTLPFFGGKVVGGFKESPAHETEYADKQVLNLHSYCCQAKPGVCDTGEPLLEDAKTVCPLFHEHKIQSHLKTAKSLGVPLIITEFGACSNTEACYHEMQGFVQAAENNHVSWCYWMYKPFGDHTTTAYEHTEGIFLDDGKTQDNKIRALTQPYFQYYQGSPIESKFNPLSKDFYSMFLYNKNIENFNVLYFNSEFFYPNGFEVSVQDEQGRDVEYITNGVNDANYFIFKIEDKKINKDSEIIKVVIRSK